VDINMDLKETKYMSKQNSMQVFIRKEMKLGKFSSHPTLLYHLPTFVVTVVKSAAGESTVNGESN
jgi:hypothetical protein